MSVVLSHPNGLTKIVPAGFSWTTLFFGFFPALFRGDIKWAAIMLVAALCTFGVSGLIFPFFYNKVYMNDLMEKGYRFANGGPVGNGQVMLTQ